MSKQIYTFLLSLCAVLVWTSCSNDVADSGTTDDGGVDVTLTVAAREPYATGLATRAFSDTHATDGEMMKNYIIVAVNQSTGKITHILQSGDLGTEVESSSYKEKVHFDTGTYTFYTFANLTLDQLGLASAKVGDVMGTDVPDLTTQTIAVDGNKATATAFTSGIPMSSVTQSVVLNARSEGVSLYVTRMVAKMTLRLSNATTLAMRLNSITLSDITKNASLNANTKNLYLLPDVATDASQVEYCRPHLTSAATAASGYGDYTIKPQTAMTAADGSTTQTDGVSIPANSSSSPTDVTFYVNESQAHDPANIQLTLNITSMQPDGTTITTNNRYALLDWTYIGRNDYRVIPITIDDYKLTFDVKYFTAIGVLPPTVTDDGQDLDLGFTYYGDIHLVPKLSTWGGTAVPDDVSRSLIFADSPWVLASGSNPEGFFATAPYWNSTNKWVEGSIGFTEGTSAVYRLQCTITKTDGTTETLARNVRFKMTPAKLGAKAFTRAADRTSWQWITASESTTHNK